MLPPPAPMVWMSTIGIGRGNGPTSPSLVTVGAASRTRETSALVPPMSMAMRSRHPAAAPMNAAPRTPAAGPESAMWTGSRIASRGENIPPFDFITKNGASTPRSARPDSILPT